LGRQHIEKRPREVKEICQYFLGIEPTRELIPVRPAQHYSMGGIRTVHRGESPSFKGLFACGEAACWDMHGFNRLGGNPELMMAYRVRRMLKLALCVVYGALQRTESRGAHFRDAHPRRDDRNWLKRTLATWAKPGDTLPTPDYESIDVMKMEMPPGWRGYGPTDHIDHPQTEVRREAIGKIRRQMAGAGPEELQRAIMPFRHLLPGSLRGRNARLGGND